MEYLNSLSSDVTEIDIKWKNLSILPDLSRFTCLQKLDCSHNQLIRLGNLPSSLIELYCYYNRITPFNKSTKTNIFSINQFIFMNMIPIFSPNSLNFSCTHFFF